MTVLEDVTVRLMDSLRAGLVDLAVMALPARGHDLECYPLRTERLFAILPKGHRLAKKRTLVMKELREEPFLLLRDDHCFRETAIEICKRARILPQVIFESGQFSSILGMVGAGWEFPLFLRWRWSSARTARLFSSPMKKRPAPLAQPRSKDISSTGCKGLSSIICWRTPRGHSRSKLGRETEMLRGWRYSSETRDWRFALFKAYIQAHAQVSNPV